MTDKGGRPPYAPSDKDRATVKAMAGYGILQDEIARVIGTTGKTLRRHFREELDIAATQANAQVAQTLFRKATGEGHGSVTAAIFWLKVRAGWTERSQIDMNMNARPDDMSDAQLAVIAAVEAVAEEDEE